MQEVALVLRDIARLVQLSARRALHQAAVVAGRKPRSTQPLGVSRCGAELDLTIAQDIGVAGASDTLLL